MAKEILINKITSEKILNDYLIASSAIDKLHTAATEDFEVLLGKQWTDKDYNYLKNTLKVTPLTINKVQPYVFLLSGLQRQNRTDFKGFPVGDEDSIIAEMATRLMKYLMDQSQGDYSESEQFEDGITGGFGYLEPFVDYTYDPLTGDFQIPKINPFSIYPSPGYKKYDMSDCKYIIKVTTDLSKEDLYNLFPDKLDEIDKIKGGRIDEEGKTVKVIVRRRKYEDSEGKAGNEFVKEDVYDLIEYYYKKYIKKYIVVDKQNERLKEAKSQEEAEAYQQQVYEQLAQEALSMREATAIETESEEETIDLPEIPLDAVTIIEKYIPEIWRISMVGTETIIDEKRAWCYPSWKGYPFIPFYAHWTTTPINDTELMTQGLVRSLKSPQFELNKRRTQELRHINSTANSGWIHEQGAWQNPDMVKKFGSAPGVDLVFKKGWQKPERIFPAPFPEAYARLAIENTQDMKEISGINTEALAMSEKALSGKAIILRQRQGLVMVQRILDNFGRTKKIKGKFLISQFNKLFTPRKVKQVLGEAFIKDRFGEPYPQVDEAGNPRLDELGNPIMAVLPNTDGELDKRVNEELVGQAIAKLLLDSATGKFDVAVGENVNNTTIRYANYMTMVDLASQGVAIPPELIIDLSDLDTATKGKYREYMLKAQAMAQQAAGSPAEK